jgi:hypothetical protein
MGRRRTATWRQGKADAALAAVRGRSILEVMDDPNLWAPWFKDPATWGAWRCVLKALFALPMDSADAALFQHLTGRATPPVLPVVEGWTLGGRRSGKSFIGALVATYLAVFIDWTPRLQRGERAHVVVIARDRPQGRIVLRYIRALLADCPVLKPLIQRETMWCLDLACGVTIEVATANFRTTRGYTIVAAVLDEIGYWWSDLESANPDVETLRALRPAMGTVPGAMLLALSTSYRRSGALWEAFRDHYGHDGDPALVVKGTTRDLNPTFAQEIVDAALAADPVAAASEYLAEFRSDLQAALDPAWIDQATDHDRPVELQPQPRLGYVAHCDPSGGKADSFALAVAHRENDAVVLDLAREVRAPFNPQDVTAEFAALLKSYGLRRVTGDRYSGAWVEREFAAHGISYESSRLSASEIYGETIPLFARGGVRLPNQPRLRQQLVALERRTGRAGCDTISHPLGAHDDLANAATGALVEAGAAPVAAASLRDARFGHSPTFGPRTADRMPWDGGDVPQNFSVDDEFDRLVEGQAREW